MIEIITEHLQTKNLEATIVGIKLKYLNFHSFNTFKSFLSKVFQTYVRKNY